MKSFFIALPRYKENILRYASRYDKYAHAITNTDMSKIKIADLTGKTKKPEIQTLSNAKTTQIIGGDRTDNGRPSPPCPTLHDFLNNS